MLKLLYFSLKLFRVNMEPMLNVIMYSCQSCSCECCYFYCNDNEGLCAAVSMVLTHSINWYLLLHRCPPVKSTKPLLWKKVSLIIIINHLLLLIASSSSAAAAAASDVYLLNVH